MITPYSFAHELGFGAKTIVTMSENGSVDVAFETTNKLPEGTLVKLTADMHVEPVAGATDKPIGMVVAYTETNGRKRVTVKTEFLAIARAHANNAIVAGNYLNALGLTVDETMSYQAHTSTNVRSAVALTSGNGVDIVVGILKTSI